MCTFKVFKKPNVLNLRFKFCPPPPEARRVEGGGDKKNVCASRTFCPAPYIYFCIRPCPISLSCKFLVKLSSFLSFRFFGTSVLADFEVWRFFGTSVLADFEVWREYWDLFIRDKKRWKGKSKKRKRKVRKKREKRGKFFSKLKNYLH